MELQRLTWETEAQSGKVTTMDSVCNRDLDVTGTTPWELTDSETMETSHVIAEQVMDAQETWATLGHERIHA